MNRLIHSAVAVALAVGSIAASTGTAMAQWRDNRPPPPRHYHHHDNGSAIAGGLAAGVIGGIIGGAIVNSGGPRYIDPPPPPPPPPPRCWFEDRRVPNAYDGGWHMESMRVCQ